jgi:hypothetical protein
MVAVIRVWVTKIQQVLEPKKMKKIFLEIAAKLLMWRGLNILYVKQYKYGNYEMYFYFFMKVSCISKIKSNSFYDKHYYIDYNQDEFVVEGQMIILWERRTKITLVRTNENVTMHEVYLAVPFTLPAMQ